MSEQSSPSRTSDVPEIAAFRYTAEPDTKAFNPLNLNGLRFGGGHRSLTDRLLHGIRFRLPVSDRPAAAHSTEAPGEGLGIFQYHLPLQEYRAQRRRQARLAQRIAIAVAIAVPVGATAFYLRPHPTPMAQAPVVQAPVAAQAVTPQAPAAHAAATALTSYQIQSGDTLSGIAHRHHVRVHDLMAANGLTTGDRLKIGTTLHLLAGMAPVAVAKPRAAALTTKAALATHEAAGAPVRSHRVTYRIQSGDSLSTVAHRFGVKTSAIVAINDLDRHTRLRIGRKLLIPASHEVRHGDHGAAIAPHRHYRQHDGRKLASRGLLGDLGRMVSKHFLWPTMGRVSSYFGYRGDHFHTGLDIPNHPGAPIHASKPGVVVAAHWDGNYGKTIDISHGNGVVTRYAHCSKLLVHPGQHVAQGQTIALVGQTGHATGPHLHYEVRINGRPIDPERVL